MGKTKNEVNNDYSENLVIMQGIEIYGQKVVWKMVQDGLELYCPAQM